jgi:hypothetical protein
VQVIDIVKKRMFKSGSRNQHEVFFFSAGTPTDEQLVHTGESSKSHICRCSVFFDLETNAERVRAAPRLKGGGTGHTVSTAGLHSERDDKQVRETVYPPRRCSNIG